MSGSGVCGSGKEEESADREGRRGRAERGEKEKGKRSEGERRGMPTGIAHMKGPHAPGAEADMEDEKPALAHWRGRLDGFCSPTKGVDWV